jgi:hypothetical protein
VKRVHRNEDAVSELPPPVNKVAILGLSAFAKDEDRTPGSSGRLLAAERSR